MEASNRNHENYFRISTLARVRGDVVERLLTLENFFNEIFFSVKNVWMTSKPQVSLLAYTPALALSGLRRWSCVYPATICASRGRETCSDVSHSRTHTRTTTTTCLTRGTTGMKVVPQGVFWKERGDIGSTRPWYGWVCPWLDLCLWGQKDFHERREFRRRCRGSQQRLQRSEPPLQCCLAFFLPWSSWNA